MVVVYELLQSSLDVCLRVLLSNGLSLGFEVLELGLQFEDLGVLEESDYDVLAIRPHVHLGSFKSQPSILQGDAVGLFDIGRGRVQYFHVL